MQAGEKNELEERHNQVVAEREREKIATEERHNQLVRDLKESYSDALEWLYSVETISRDYWLDKGHTEEYADEMEILLDSFIRIIKGLRMGTTGSSVWFLVFRLQDEEGNHITADHDDVLMPYWTEFANALIHWSKYHATGRERISMVSFFNVETPDAVLDILRPALKQAKVNYVGLENNSTPQTWKLAEIIEDVIQTNHKVMHVSLGGNILSNEEFQTICNAIRRRNAEQSSAMQCITLKKCFADGINTDMLKKILSCNTVAIWLAGNGLSSREAMIIAEFLNSNPTLARLNLRDNRFYDADAAVLANSLSSNTNLRSLDVSGNTAMTADGRLSILRVIFDVSGLASCAASNQSCRVFGFEQGHQLEQGISSLNFYTNVVFNKLEKIFAMLALSEEHSFINTALLSGVPASLMPKLLYSANYPSPEKQLYIQESQICI
ncbi:hypothetical protein THAOC_06940 [Thalassiosira oceanica]|uniref:Uncharacterized protein n=1 Tax=Thalassiosira oceanica TaxID=159749 RepID=K0T383_THAOC|nr:hypothetical protein THAOC_06940 [Thalassiosira oceanica]|eukprot:EJK71599.1 hypothetical protein THAOC_06940 [Thalassiosira oceanica]